MEVLQSSRLARYFCQTDRSSGECGDLRGERPQSGCSGSCLAAWRHLNCRGVSGKRPGRSLERNGIARLRLPPRWRPSSGKGRCTWDRSESKSSSPGLDECLAWRWEVSRRSLPASPLWCPPILSTGTTDTPWRPGVPEKDKKALSLASESYNTTQVQEETKTKLTTKKFHSHSPFPGSKSSRHRLCLPYTQKGWLNHLPSPPLNTVN